MAAEANAAKNTRKLGLIAIVIGLVIGVLLLDQGIAVALLVCGPCIGIGLWMLWAPPGWMTDDLDRGNDGNGGE